MITTYLSKRLIYPISLALLLTLFLALPALAQGPVVNTLADDESDGCATGNCTLREAITAATVGDTITFHASIEGGTIMLGDSELSIDKELTIDGQGRAITISGDNSFQVFYIGGSGVVTLSHLTIYDGLNVGGAGGGIENYGTLTVQNSAFSSNSASEGVGGGIANGGTLTVQNSTFFNNRADNGGGSGGGIYNGGTLTVQNSTFSGNSADFGGGIYNSGTLDLQNTIIANNTGDDCMNDGTISTNDHNLIEDGTCSPAFSGDPNLGSLADNGGDTLTFALLDGSTAINAGNDTTCLSTDQRGTARPQGAACDIGAYEAELGIPPTVTGHSPITNTVAAPLASSVVLTYSVEISAATVTSQTVAIHSMQRGLVTETHGVADNVVTVNPADDFFPGELVYAVATAGTTDITGTNASATQWQFNAAVTAGWGGLDGLPVNVGSGSDNTASMAWGDWDNDGDLDLAVGNNGQNAVYPNNGDGSFGTGIDFGTGTDDTYSVAWGDWDNDGDLDLAVGNYGWPNAVYPNNGDGTFGTAVNVGPGDDMTTSVAWGDFDNDGDLDLAVGNYGWPNAVYPNNGDGTFGAAVNFGTGNDYTASLAWGDFDNDGDLDLAVGNFGGQNAVYPNNGDGDFGTAVNFGISSDYTMSVAWGDFDNDGDLDLAEGNDDGFNYLHPNNGDGTFDTAVTISSYGYSVAWGDWDNDGYLDLAVGKGNYNQNAVYPNNGDGTFGAAIDFGTGSDNTYSLAWADFDNDGDLDLAVGNGNGEQNVVYVNSPPPPSLTNFSPARNVITAPLDSSVVFTYSAELSAATVTSQSVAIHSMQRGLIAQTPNHNGAVLTIDPTTDFFPGELVYAIATAGTADITGTHAVAAQWQFNAAVTQGWGNLGAPVNFGSSSDTYSAAWGDFDNDGDLDLAVGNSNQQNVVYPNNGDGSFGTAVNVGPGNDWTSSVAWGDFDNDGDLDLAVGNASNSQNAVYPNNGDGSFGPAINVGPGNDSTFSVAWGDFDNDGDLDLAVGNSGQNAIYPNNGDGSFGAAVNVGPGNDMTFNVAWGDFDNDGDLDLAVGNLIGQSTVYLNNGNGTFGATVDFGPSNSFAYNLAWGDFDNDGDLDLAVAANGGQSAVYPNNGNGSFGAAINVGPGSSMAINLAWGDWDNDGDLDLAVAVNGGQSAVYPNSGAGSFGTAVNVGSANAQTRSVAWGDADNDGDLDLAVGTSGQNAVYLNSPPPILTGFSPARNAVDAPLDSSVVLTYSAEISSASVTSQTVAVHSMQRGLLTGSHGVVDNVVTVDPAADFFPGELVYAIATNHTTDITGTRSLTAAQWQFNAAVTKGFGRFDTSPVNVGSGSDSTFSAAWGDFDNDGDLDLAVGNWNQPNMVYPNNGDGTFGAAISVTTDSYYTRNVAWGDFDNDGDLDLAVGNDGQPNLVFPNNGDGTFGNGIQVTADSNNTFSVAWGDFDNDGDLDLAVGNKGDNGVYHNNGDGTFGPAVDLQDGDDTQSVAWGDFDNDGDLDLAVGNDGSNYIYPNNGDGTFGTRISAGSYNTGSVAWGDFDHDGDLDLAAGSIEGATYVYPNNGNGTFGTAINFQDGGDTYSVAWGDVDGDGDLDLAVANFREQNAVYLNNGDGTFGPAVNFGAGNDATRGVAWADFDGDGDLDLAAGNNGGQNAVYLNEPDVLISKTVSAASAKPGESITYTLAYTNASYGLVTGVVITDSVPLSVTNPSVVDSSGAAITQTGTAPNFVWQVANLGGGAGGVITLTGVLTQPLAAGSIITNTAEITSAEAEHNSASAVLTVQNAAPLAAADVVTTTEDTPLIISPLTNDSDLNGDNLSLVSGMLGSPAHGTAAISGTSQIVYTPTLNYNGTDSFLYAVSDGSFAATGGSMSSFGTITVTVQSVNDAPVITDSTPINVTMSEDGSPTAFDLTLHASDPDAGDTLTWSIATQPISGTATASGTDSTKAIGYTPPANWHGSTVFTVAVSDGTISDTIAVTVTVESVNDAPVAVDDTALVMRDDSGDLTVLVAGSSITIPVLLNDSDPVEGDSLTIVAVGTPSSGGTAQVLGSDSFITYTPTATFTGQETFSYTISDSSVGATGVDGGGLTDTAVVTVTVVNGDGGDSTGPDDNGGQTLVIPGTGISGTITATIEIPAGVISDSKLSLVFNTISPPGSQLPSEDYAAGILFFSLDAYLDHALQAGYTFTPPITLTVEYSDEDVAGLSESTLALFYWDEGSSSWQSDGIELVERDTANNRLVVRLYHLTDFGLFAEDTLPIFLPIITKNFISAPDLVITTLSVDSGSITVTLKNQGNAAVTDDFWVDVYFNPTQTPALNKPWNSIAPAGATWGVTTDIPAGDSLTLTVGDAYYAPQYSSSSFPAGAQVYGYVDSVDHNSSTGAVYESDENNNLFGAVTSTVGDGAAPLSSQGDGSNLAHLPQR